jgi:hypothetical protein
MSAWLTWFQNYLNPSKLIAVTVPGMVVAFALVLVLGPVPCRQKAACPYCTSQLKPVEGDATQSPQNQAQGNDANPQPAKQPENAAPTPAKQPEKPAQQSDVGAQAKTNPLAACEFPDPSTKGIDGGSTILCVRVSKQTIRDESTIEDINGLITLANAPIAPQQKSRDVQQLEKALNLLPVEQLQDASSGSNPSPKKVPGADDGTSPGRDGGPCSVLPSFVVASSLAAVNQKGIKAAQKAADNAGQLLVRFDSFQAAVRACNARLQVANASLQQNNGALQAFITQAGGDLTGLSTNLASAQNAGEVLVAESLERRIGDKRRLLAWAQGKQTAIKNCTNALAALQGRVTTMVQLGTTAPTDASKSTSPVQDVLAAIQDNLIKFLVLSLIIGQILDPLQRGVVSFFGPRRKFFEAFNLVYGQAGDGEFRYGDRRLLPWIRRDGTILPDPRAEATLNIDANAAELRANAAARAFVKDRNVYDRNYAVGAGYISESDAKMIEDNFYTQSQITSGLIFPMVLLSICLGIREVCCTAALSKDYFTSSVVIFLVLPFAVILSGLITLIGLMLSSGKYSQLVGASLKNYFFWTPNDPINDAGVDSARKKRLDAQKRWDPIEKEIRDKHGVESRFDMYNLIAKADDHVKGAKWALDESEMALRASEERRDRAKRERQLGRWRQLVMVGIGVVLFVIGLCELLVRAHGIGRGDFVLIMLPTLTVFPLWIAGLDRLHKFYSELQARIAGNILRLEATTEQKFIDLLADDTAACAMKAKFKSMVQARRDLDTLLRNRNCKPDNDPGVPPAGDQTSSTPPSGSSGGTTAGGVSAPQGNGGSS